MASVLSISKHCIDLEDRRHDRLKLEPYGTVHRLQRSNLLMCVSYNDLPTAGGRRFGIGSSQ